MKTIFPKQTNYIPKIFLIDVQNLFVGRVASIASKLLQGKNSIFYTPSLDQGNFVILINSNKVLISGNKIIDKKYYKKSTRPGNLKIYTFTDIKNKNSTKILEYAIKGMLPKTHLGKLFYNRLYIYKDSAINNFKFTLENKINYIQL